MRLRANFLINELESSSCFALALCDKVGKVTFSDDASLSINRIVQSSVALEGGIEVEATTLDVFASEHFNKAISYIVKIDVEGGEGAILRGGKEFFTNYRVPYVVFECFAIEKIAAIFKDYGYEIKRLSENNFEARKISTE